MKSAAWLLLVLLPACGASDAAPPPTPRNVLLISLDTLRADHCGFMGHTRPTTPFLDELAARGVVLANHFSHSNNTLTSHASLLTGLDPLTHRVEHETGTSERHGLAPGFVTLAEAFQANGWSTAAFTAHKAWLSARFGLDQGFDVMDAEWRDANAVGAKFLEWYDAHQPQRLFAFLHFFDAHSDVEAWGARLPYESSAELVQRLAGPPPPGFTGRREVEPLKGCCTDWLRAVHEGHEPLPEAHREYVERLYDAGIAKLDADLRRFFAELEARGLLEDALVVVTSDHGEEFGEHGGMLHYGWTDELLHVPLVVLATGLAPRRLEHVTRAIDVAPTLAELARLELPPGAFAHGQSLAATLTQGTPVGDGLLVLGAPGLRLVQGGRYKLVEPQTGPALYDLDAGEDTNLIDRPGRPARIADTLRARLRVLEAEAAALRARTLEAAGPFVPSAAEIDARRLRELGYL
jgi:arylsulfatase A-like enzyme